MRFLSLIRERIQKLTAKFPTQRNREFFGGEHRIFGKEQGILAPEQGTRPRTNFLTLRARRPTRSRRQGEDAGTVGAVARAHGRRPNPGQDVELARSSQGVCELFHNLPAAELEVRNGWSGVVFAQIRNTDQWLRLIAFRHRTASPGAVEKAMSSIAPPVSQRMRSRARERTSRCTNSSPLRISV
jgi:hypothetical protein